MSEEFEPRETVEETRQREILEARQRAMEARAHNLSSAFDGMGRTQRLLAYREVVEEYILEIEPLWHKTRVLDKFWTEKKSPLGSVVAEPPNAEDLIETTSAKYNSGHPPIVDDNLERRSVATIHSLRQLLDVEQNWTVEWYVEVYPRQGARKRYNTISSTVVGADVLDRCVRAANHTVNRMGLDLDPEPGSHRSQKAGL